MWVWSRIYLEGKRWKFYNRKPLQQSSIIGSTKFKLVISACGQIPGTAVAMSSALPGCSSSLKSELTTRFQRSGYRSPPCGVPLWTFFWQFVAPLWRSPTSTNYYTTVTGSWIRLLKICLHLASLFHYWCLWIFFLVVFVVVFLFICLLFSCWWLLFIGDLIRSGQIWELWFNKRTSNQTSSS